MKLDNVKLRAVEPEDILALYEIENNMELWVASETLVPFSRFQLKQYIQSMNNDIYESKELRLMIDYCEGEKAIPVGIIDLFDFDPFHNRGGVGIMVSEKYRSKGVASTALELFINYCFSHLGLHQLYCSILTTNTASIKLFEYRKFERVGLRKQWRKVNNTYVDEYFYQLINIKA